MKTIAKYRKLQILFLFLIFLIFTAIIAISEYRHEKKYRLYSLNRELNGYSNLINNFINTYKINDLNTGIDSLVNIFPDKKLRFSIIDLKGNVLYDTQIKDVKKMENHLYRPEIQEALKKETGTNIRISTTTQTKYYYFAKKFENYIVRLSVPYNLEAKQLLEPDNLSLLFLILVFFLASVAFIVVTDKFGKSISTLKEFTIQVTENKPFINEFSFPKNELGDIGQNIVDIYQKLNNSQKELISEKEKLIRHLNLLEEGVAIYNSEYKPVSNNNHFIQFVNLISDTLIYSATDLFDVQEFEPIKIFIEKQLQVTEINKNQQPSYEINITKNGRIFTARCIIFHDKSFEIIIIDTTRPAKRKILKQQITDNIAHELKTPVSSVKGFLETILNNKIPEPKLTEFLKRAYSQTIRLSDLINDISLLTKIEEAGTLYNTEQVNISEIIQNIIDDVQLKLKENAIKIEMKIPEYIVIQGNHVLLYSIFRNLFDNAIIYAGNQATINLKMYVEDSQFYYFSFSDNGSGVPDHDLPRLFERFYRVDKGRDRKSGGTGLGLAIVKNAILFHKGEISVKNKKEGGLEFLFSLAKNQSGNKNPS